VCSKNYIEVALELDQCGLVWHPAIGDEVIERQPDPQVSILVDSLGMSASELRRVFVWLPTLEQLIEQIEARKGIICHAGMADHLTYQAVVKTSYGLVELKDISLRVALAKALRALIQNSVSALIH
jgi:hypothetical protein